MVPKIMWLGAAVPCVGHTFAHLYSRHIHIHVAASHFSYPLLFEPQKSVVLDFTGQSPGIGANEVGHFYPKTQFFSIKCGFSHVIGLFEILRGMQPLEPTFAESKAIHSKNRVQMIATA